MKIAVCEDDITTQSILESYLEEYPADLEWEIFSSGEELLEYIEKGKDYFSLYFMDISLPGIDGIQTCARIRKRDQKALIVFVTDYKEYVYEVFQVLPFRFLIKPVKKKAFFKVLGEAMEFLRLHDKRPLPSISGRPSMRFPGVKSCTWKETFGRSISIRQWGEYTFYGKLEKLKEQLSPGGFFPVSQILCGESGIYPGFQGYIHYSPKRRGDSRKQKLPERSKRKTSAVSERKMGTMNFQFAALALNFMFDIFLYAVTLCVFTAL